MPLDVACILGVLGAIGATVVAVIMLMPQKNVPKMNKFFYELHKIVNFKSLLLEKILKILYVFATCACLLIGFFMLLSWDSYWGATVYNGGTGLLLMLLGPIVVRIVFEAAMMFVLLVNNTIEIRKHLTDSKESEPAADEEKKVAPEYVFCTRCGTRYDKNSGNCPNGCANE